MLHAFELIIIFYFSNDWLTMASWKNKKEMTFSISLMQEQIGLRRIQKRYFRR